MSKHFQLDIGDSSVLFCLPESADVSRDEAIMASRHFYSWIGENLHANVSLLRNRKFDLVSQSGWITLHATISCELDFRFARSCAAIALPDVCTSVFEYPLGAFRSKSLKM